LIASSLDKLGCAAVMDVPVLIAVYAPTGRRAAHLATQT